MCTSSKEEARGGGVQEKHWRKTKLLTQGVGGFLKTCFLAGPQSSWFTVFWSRPLQMALSKAETFLLPVVIVVFAQPRSIFLESLAL